MAAREVTDEMLARRAIRRLQRLGVRHVQVEARARKVVARGSVSTGRTTKQIHGEMASSPLEALETLADAAREEAAGRRGQRRRARAARLARADVLPAGRREREGRLEVKPGAVVAVPVPGAGMKPDKAAKR